MYCFVSTTFHIFRKRCFHVILQRLGRKKELCRVEITLGAEIFKIQIQTLSLQYDGIPVKLTSRIGRWLFVWHVISERDGEKAFFSKDVYFPAPCITQVPFRKTETQQVFQQIG